MVMCFGLGGCGMVGGVCRWFELTSGCCGR